MCRQSGKEVEGKLIKMLMTVQPVTAADRLGDRLSAEPRGQGTDKQAMRRWSGKKTEGKPIKTRTTVQPVTAAERLGDWLSAEPKDQ